MFLHSGAGLHGHEYSNRNQPPRRPFLKSTLAAKTSAVSVTENRSGQTHPPQIHQDSSPLPPPPPPRPQDSLLAQRDRNADRVPTEAPSSLQSDTDDGLSTHESDVSDGPRSSLAPAKKKSKPKRRRAPRQCDKFIFADPAPRFTDSKQILRKTRRRLEPTLHLQLQALCANQRVRPIIDVFSATLNSGWLRDGARSLLRNFDAKGDVGKDDVVLVKSEDFAQTTSPHDDKEGSAQRELIAIFRYSRKDDKDPGTSMIILSDGSIWTARPFGSGGSFEFTLHSREKSLTARWVRRAAGPNPVTSPVGPTASNQVSCNWRYTFSLINPSSRRHPVMATLTSSQLEVQQEYSPVSTSHGRYPPTRSLRSLSSACSETCPESTTTKTPNNSAPPLPAPERERVSLPIDSTTKTLISITAIWVVLRLGGDAHRIPTASSSDFLAMTPNSAASSHTNLARHSPRSVHNSIVVGAGSFDLGKDRDHISTTVPSSASNSTRSQKNILRRVTMPISLSSETSSTSVAAHYAGHTIRRAISNSASHARRRLHMSFPQHGHDSATYDSRGARARLRNIGGNLRRHSPPPVARRTRSIEIGHSPQPDDHVARTRPSSGHNDTAEPRNRWSVVVVESPETRHDSAPPPDEMTSRKKRERDRAARHGDRENRRSSRVFAVAGLALGGGDGADGADRAGKLKEEERGKLRHILRRWTVLH